MIPTEPIGSLPRPPALIEAVEQGGSDDPRLDPLYEDAIRDTIERFEATGSPVITDGEQRKYHNFWTYSVHGLPNTAPDGFKIPFTAGHTRRMPRLTRGPFRYKRYADSYLDVAKRYARPPAQAGGHLAVRAEPHVSRRRHPGLLARAIHRRSAGGARTEIRRCFAEGRLQGPDRLHRGPVGHEGRPVRASPAQLHRSEQPGAVAVLDRGAAAHRRAHLPWRRSRFDAQRRRRLRRAAAEPVSAEGRQLLHRAGRRTRSRARAEDHSPVHEARPPGLRRRRRADRPARRNAPRKCATASSKRRSTFRSSSWARPTIADSRPSATTRRRPATRRSPRFARACSGPRSRPRRSEHGSGEHCDDEEQLLRSVALQNASSILLARQRAEEELLRTKEALRESQERLTAALTAAGTGTFRWNIPDEHRRVGRQSRPALRARAGRGRRSRSTRSSPPCTPTTARP